MDRIEICRACTEAFEQHVELVASFDAANINEIPFEGSWTAGQVVQHTILANSGFVQLLNGTVADTSRPVDLIVPRITKDFLDFSTKMKSPESILPENRRYEPIMLLERVTQIQGHIGDVIQDCDLTKTCTTFEIPGYGLLTRMEAVHFVVCHTKRHNHQLRSIRNFLNGSAKVNVFGWLLFEFLSHSGDRFTANRLPIFW